MAAGSFVKHSYDCTVTITDGGVLTATPGLFTGTTTISNVQRKRRNVQHYQVRGKLVAVRHTDLVLPTFQLTFYGANYSGAVSAAGGSEINVKDIFNQAGTWAGATSTLDQTLGGSDVFCVDVEIRLEGTDFGDGADHSAIYRAVHGIPSDAIDDPMTVVVDCTCYGDIAGDLNIPMPDLS